MFRKIVEYITLLVKKVVRHLFGSSRKGYAYGRRNEPELQASSNHDFEEFRSEWLCYMNEYGYNIECWA